RHALSCANRRDDHEQVRSRGANIAHELGDYLQLFLVASLGRLRERVAVLELRRAEIAQISADTRLRREVPFRAQQLDKLGLSIHRAFCEQASNSSTPLVLFEGCTWHWRETADRS